ncbi:MAG TPA: 16S rRNA (guanine(527)-N(7))-methyltransferase RsmG [Kofleriaceae bacterium]|nr:16S rRNA (guanine(527)-N(7))-methyltransferase RsmG [Kofleriaceae bacterium]
MTQHVIEPSKLAQFQDLFLQWNRRINLSAARTPDEVDAHVRDSLEAVPHLAGSLRVIDVGSGGGFPVLIAALALPALSFTALEPIHKKHAFLRTAARELGLSNLEALAQRVEDHARHDYDAATSRATFDLREWLLLGARLVRPGGLVLGFEATPRDDLPAQLERHAYELDGKRRAIVLHRP